MKRRTLILGSAAALIGYGWPSDPGAAARLVTTPPQAAAGQPHWATVAKIIAFARDQAGKPYLWGGTGPGSFDCSGLVMKACAAAGITIPRTSQEQWAAGPRVTSPQPGDLVFFPGSDGTWDKPGHVGLVTGAHVMIQAYAPGTPIGTYPYGVPSALGGTRSGDVIGFTRPWKTP